MRVRDGSVQIVFVEHRMLEVGGPTEPDGKTTYNALGEGSVKTDQERDDPRYGDAATLRVRATVWNVREGEGNPI